MMKYVMMVMVLVMTASCGGDTPVSEVSRVIPVNMAGLCDDVDAWGGFHNPQLYCREIIETADAAGLTDVVPCETGSPGEGVAFLCRRFEDGSVRLYGTDRRLVSEFRYNRHKVDRVLTYPGQEVVQTRRSIDLQSGNGDIFTFMPGEELGVESRHFNTDWPSFVGFRSEQRATSVSAQLVGSKGLIEVSSQGESVAITINDLEGGCMEVQRSDAGGVEIMAYAAPCGSVNGAGLWDVGETVSVPW